MHSSHAARVKTVVLIPGSFTAPNLTNIDCFNIMTTLHPEAQEYYCVCKHNSKLRHWVRCNKRAKIILIQILEKG